MRKRFLLLLSMMTSLAGMSAAQHIWEPDTTLKMKARLPFSRAQVIDLRLNKEKIGFLSIGAFNRQDDLVTEKPLDLVLTNYINTLIRTSSYEGRLLVLIRDFTLEDAVHGENTGSVRLSSEVYMAAGAGYRHLIDVDTFYEIYATRDVSQPALQLLSDAVYDLVARAAAAANAAAPRQPLIYSEAAAVARHDSIRAQYPLYAATEIPHALFKTYDDLLHLRASDTAFIDERIRPREGPDYSEFYYKNRHGRKGRKVSPDDFFAVSDGKRLFIARSDRFTTLVKKDGEFYANLYRAGVAPPTQVGLALGIGGIAGGLVAGATFVVARVAMGPNKTQAVLYRCELIPDRKIFLPVQRVR